MLFPPAPGATAVYPPPTAQVPMQPVAPVWQTPYQGNNSVDNSATISEVGPASSWVGGGA